jgi:hypothetical protein
MYQAYFRYGEQDEKSRREKEKSPGLFLSLSTGAGGGMMEEEGKERKLFSLLRDASQNIAPSHYGALSRERERSSGGITIDAICVFSDSSLHIYNERKERHYTEHPLRKYL